MSDRAPRTPGGPSAQPARPVGGMFGRGPIPGLGMPAEKPRHFRATMRQLVGYLRPFWTSIALVIVFAVASTLFAIVSPTHPRQRDQRSCGWVQSASAPTTRCSRACRREPRSHPARPASNCSPVCRSRSSMRSRRRNARRSPKPISPHVLASTSTGSRDCRFSDRSLRLQRPLRLYPGLDHGGRHRSG